EELKKIYTGEITSWKKFAWKDSSIYLYGRSRNSGTRYFLREHLLQGESYSPDMLVFSRTSALVRAVQKNPFSIGYGGFAYGDDVKLVRVNDVEINPENIRNDAYPISRYLYLYTVNKPRGRTKKFIDWTMTETGQKIVQESGLLPIIKF
ncbi:MAG: phosphate ABC transporter substrate-binding protein, partial [Calditrichaeota bacterium]